MEKKNKRIRHPKKKEQEIKNEEPKKHFVLEVHDSSVTSKSKIGN
jgi:hypothetical protein